MSLNLSGVVSAFRLVYNPALFLPHVTIPTFKDLPIPLKVPGSETPIKVVLIDKDNCFAEPHSNKVWPEYQETWKKLREEYPGPRLMIVSNTSGSSSDVGDNQARQLEQATGTKVFRHIYKKPACDNELMAYLEQRGLITSPKEVAVVGDRLFTDVALANNMGAYAFWVSEGIVPNTSIFSQFEKKFYNFMKNSGINPPNPEA